MSLQICVQIHDLTYLDYTYGANTLISIFISRCNLAVTIKNMEITGYNSYAR